MEKANDTWHAGDTEPALSAKDLAQRLRQGDAFAVREARKRVKRILAHGTLTIPADKREDLEQEIMTEIWQAVNRPHFDASGGFWSFIEVVTSRRCIDWLRARKQQVSVPEDLVSTAPGPLRQVMQRERVDLASETLSSLGAPCRQLLMLRLHDDLSYGEIARITGKTEGSLRVQFHRCIERARKILNPAASGADRSSRDHGTGWRRS